MFKSASGDDLVAAHYWAPCTTAGSARAARFVKSTGLKAVLCLGLALAAALTAAASAGAATLVVDKDRQQCRDADYTTIMAAVAAADAGDNIAVCPDLYAESVVVSTPDLKLRGRGRLPQHCDDATPAAADPSQHVIVTAPGNPAFDLQADDVVLRGFVVQESDPGIRTGQSFSGYRVERNFVQDNRVGSVFGGSGERVSRLSHNCFRRNGAGPAASAVFSSAAFDGELHDGRIEHNVFHANAFAIRLGGGEDIRVAHNRSSLDGVFIRPAFTRALEILHNRIRSGTGSALWFFRNPMVPQPNTAAVVSHNVINGRGGHAITADAGALTNSLISHNTLTSNAMDGINLQTGNTGNEIEYNRTDDNGSDGIHAQGAIGNAFVRNRMSGNAEHDAHDDNRPANQWTGNRCHTDLPAGSICAR